MPSQSRAGVEAFVDRGFPDSKTFCTQFLYSPELSLNTLKSLVKSGKSQQKYDLAFSLATALEDQTIDSEKILLAFAQQPRKWLSFKLGHCEKYPVLKKASNLLTEFGEDGWYGPIRDPETSRKWYIRTHKVPFYEQVYQSEGVSEGEIAERLLPSCSKVTYGKPVRRFVPTGSNLGDFPAGRE